MATKQNTKNVMSKLSDKNIELKQSLALKNDFANSRFDEKKILTDIRQKYALELINIRDKVSTKRHSERIEILDKKFDFA